MSDYDDGLYVSNDTILDWAAHTVDSYVATAVYRLDATFGEGYAKANPALVAGYVHVLRLHCKELDELWNGEDGIMSALNTLPQEECNRVLKHLMHLRTS